MQLDFFYMKDKLAKEKKSYINIYIYIFHRDTFKREVVKNKGLFFTSFSY